MNLCNTILVCALSYGIHNVETRWSQYLAAFNFYYKWRTSTCNFFSQKSNHRISNPRSVYNFSNSYSKWHSIYKQLLWQCQHTCHSTSIVTTLCRNIAAVQQKYSCLNGKLKCEYIVWYNNTQTCDEETLKTHSNNNTTSDVWLQLWMSMGHFQSITHSVQYAEK